MDRDKYVNDASYREGYTDGRRDGVNAVVYNYSVYLNRLEAEIVLLREKLSDLKKESEDIQ